MLLQQNIPTGFTFTVGGVAVVIIVILWKGSSYIGADFCLLRGIGAPWRAVPVNTNPAATAAAAALMAWDDDGGAAASGSTPAGSQRPATAVPGVASGR